MDLDIIEKADGLYLVNELKTIFGPDPIQMKIDRKPDHYIYDEEMNKWVFKEGEYWENSCRNLRVKCLLAILPNR